MIRKLKSIEEFSAGGTVVGMVGDGIRDAPALARADIGFTMGAAGTDAAIETADVALMDDDPRKLAEFVRLSQATKAVLWQNKGANSRLGAPPSPYSSCQIHHSYGGVWG